MSKLSLHKISKDFGGTRAVDDVSLEIESGEFFSILGPSGCGKTTLLRMIAGFETPSGGKILVEGKDITGAPPQMRQIGMVFQNYALFPHMTVLQNVAFGLQAKGVRGTETRDRVERILESVHLEGKIDAPVTELSGGEQQRVAVARALVVEPRVLLFDEPLSNLDVALRVKTREEIRTLQRKTGITTIYVTHDQSEAMSLSDRIAVMHRGRIEQLGTPEEMYEKPASVFVAQFLGGANVVDGVIEHPQRRWKCSSFELVVPSGVFLPNATKSKLAIKPESVRIEGTGSTDGLEATVQEIEYLGFTTHVSIVAGEIVLRCSAISSAATRGLRVGDRVGFSFDWRGCTIFGEE